MSDSPLVLAAALGLEIRPLLRVAQDVVPLAGWRGAWTARIGARRCIVIRGGVGAPGVARSAPRLFDRCPTVEGLVSIGLAGGLDPVLSLGSVVVSGAVFPEGDPDAAMATDAGLRGQLLGGADGGAAVTVERPAWGVDTKSALRATTGAAVCEMEGVHWARAIAERRIPFASVRVVSDPAAEDLPDLGRLGDPSASRWTLARIFDPRVALRLPGLAKRASAAAAALADHLVHTLS